jgi:hypothetical protein
LPPPPTRSPEDAPLALSHALVLSRPALADAPGHPGGRVLAAVQATHTGKLLHLLEAFAVPRAHVAAQAVRRATKGMGTRDTDLITLAACAPAEALRGLREAYPIVTAMEKGCVRKEREKKNFSCQNLDSPFFFIIKKPQRCRA